MRLVNPYTGCAIDAPKDVAERLKAKGFRPAPKERAKKPAPKTGEAKEASSKQ